MKLSKSLLAAIGVALVASSANITFAQDSKAQHKDSPPNAAVNVDADMTSAEVRKVDKDSKKITLRHEAIKGLDMPAMTMVFQVRDASLLDKVRAGDKVKFRAISEGNAYVVTAIESAK